MEDVDVEEIKQLLTTVLTKFFMGGPMINVTIATIMLQLRYSYGFDILSTYSEPAATGGRSCPAAPLSLDHPS